MTCSLVYYIVISFYPILTSSCQTGQRRHPVRGGTRSETAPGQRQKSWPTFMRHSHMIILGDHHDHPGWSHNYI